LRPACPGTEPHRRRPRPPPPHLGFMGERGARFMPPPRLISGDIEMDWPQSHDRALHEGEGSVGVGLRIQAPRATSGATDGRDHRSTSSVTAVTGQGGFVRGRATGRDRPDQRGTPTRFVVTSEQKQGSGVGGRGARANGRQSSAALESMSRRPNARPPWLTNNLILVDERNVWPFSATDRPDLIPRKGSSGTCPSRLPRRRKPKGQIVLQPRSPPARPYQLEGATCGRTTCLRPPARAGGHGFQTARRRAWH